MQIVKFFNITDKPFTWDWAKVPYTFKAGEVVMMEDWKAEHFATHLIDLILHAKGLQANDPERADLMKQIVIGTDIVSESQSKA